MNQAVITPRQDSQRRQEGEMSKWDNSAFADHHSLLATSALFLFSLLWLFAAATLIRSVKQESQGVQDDTNYTIGDQSCSRPGAWPDPTNEPRTVRTQYWEGQKKKPPLTGKFIIGTTLNLLF